MRRSGVDSVIASVDAAVNSPRGTSKAFRAAMSKILHAMNWSLDSSVLGLVVR